MHQHICPRWVPSLLIVLSLTFPSAATMVLEQDLGELVDRAPLIFVGTAIDQRVEIPAGGGIPFTLVTFHIEDLVKGVSEGAQIDLAFEGGETNEEVFEVIGMPTFIVGRKYLLFVRSSGELGGCPILGWGQGKLEFRTHPQTGAEVLVTSTGALITGLEEDDWELAPIGLDGEGRIRALASTGVALVSEEGVSISGLPDLDALAAGALAATPEAETVLGSFRRFARGRRELSTHRVGTLVRSATVRGLRPIPTRSATAIPTAGGNPEGKSEGNPAGTASLVPGVSKVAKEVSP